MQNNYQHKNKQIITKREHKIQITKVMRISMIIYKHVCDLPILHMLWPNNSKNKYILFCAEYFKLMLFFKLRKKTGLA